MPDDMSEILENTKKNAVRTAMDMLAELRFNSIYSYADNLFERKEVPFGDPSIQQQIDFFRSTRLDQLEFDNMEDAAFFTMKNKDTGASIQVSNRQSTRGELRGAVLRNYLELQTQEDNSQIVYDVISSGIKDPLFSDMVCMLKASLCNENARLWELEPLKEEHFQFFMMKLLDSVDEKIRNGDLGHLEPRQIRHDPAIREQVWEGIDVNKIYDDTAIKNKEYDWLPQFNTGLQELQSKAITLRQKGYFEACSQVEALYDQLSIQRDEYINGNIPKEEFIAGCGITIRAIEKNPGSEIHKHHGLFEKALHKIREVLSSLTSGLITTKSSELQDKVNDMKATLKQMREEEPKLDKSEVVADDYEHNHSLGG